MTRASNYPGLTQRQAAALRWLAFLERRTVADLRRQAIAQLANTALQDPAIATAVDAALAYRHGPAPDNVRQIRR